MLKYMRLDSFLIIKKLSFIHASIKKRKKQHIIGKKKLGLNNAICLS